MPLQPSYQKLQGTGPELRLVTNSRHLLQKAENYNGQDAYKVNFKSGEANSIHINCQYYGQLRFIPYNTLVVEGMNENCTSFLLYLVSSAFSRFNCRFTPNYLSTIALDILNFAFGSIFGNNYISRNSTQFCSQRNCCSMVTTKLNSKLGTLSNCNYHLNRIKDMTHYILRTLN